MFLGSAAAAPFPSASTATLHRHFQVVGLSETHVALRETFDDGEPGRLAHCGYRMGPGTMGEHGVRLHLLPYQAGQFFEPGAPGDQTFPIYDSVLREEDCTPQRDAEVRLGRAKARARQAGVEMDARLTPVMLPQPPASSHLLKPLVLTVGVMGRPTAEAPLLTLTVDARGLGRELHVTTTEEGEGLDLQPPELYRFDHRSVLVFSFREQEGLEHIRLLVLDTPPVPSMLPEDEDELLAPLVLQMEPGSN
jgi:hypothetical protein